MSAFNVQPSDLANKAGIPFLAFATAEATASASQASESLQNKTTVPIHAAGDVVAAQGITNAPGMIVYQDSNTGHLVAMRVSNAFSVGHITEQTLIVAPENVLYGTPLAMAQYVPGVNDVGTLEVFFLTPNHILAEATFDATHGWQSGSSCAGCIDNKVIYKAVSGSKMFYAMATNNPQRTAGIVVGFESADFPGTITEAQRFGTWSLNPLTNA
ncbi:hypothetical protein V5O48_014453 [Marasmius crinis-equi]|uniref:Uncharacterized protein n=1 Tax=Marasmius crinis-equi TaxID=585013 RepID=A0ABR3EX85_9AGAR